MGTAREGEKGGKARRVRADEEGDEEDVSRSSIPYEDLSPRPSARSPALLLLHPPLPFALARD